MFIPLVFLGLYSLFNEDKKKHYYITIGATLLMLTHTITTEYTAFFCLIYVLLNIKKLKDIDIIKKLAINIIFILLICLFFIIPIAEHKIFGDYTILNSEQMGTTGIYVHSRGIELKKLFTGTEEESGISFVIGAPFILLIVLGFITYKKMEANYKRPYQLILLFGVISLWMSTKYFPWAIMPDFVCTLQFPWRMLMFFETAMAIIAAINLYTLISIISKKDCLNLIFTLISIILLIVSMQKINYEYKIDGNKTKTDIEYEQWASNQEKLSHFSINREYLPVKATTNKYSYLNTREDKVYILNGFANIYNEQKNSLELGFKILDGQKDTILELPYLYYLGYEAELTYNNESINLKTFESDNGFVTIQLPEDIAEGEVKVEYKGTKLEKISYTISLVSITIFITYVIYIKRKDKLNEK